MDCPNCGTWNPEDKIVCWRCGTQLPKPQPKKARRSFNTFRWMWVVVAFLLVLMIVQACIAFGNLPS